MLYSCLEHIYLSFRRPISVDSAGTIVCLLSVICVHECVFLLGYRQIQHASNECVDYNRNYPIHPLCLRSFRIRLCMDWLPIRGVQCSAQTVATDESHLVSFEWLSKSISWTLSQDPILFCCSLQPKDTPEAGGVLYLFAWTYCWYRCCPPVDCLVIL